MTTKFKFLSEEEIETIENAFPQVLLKVSIEELVEYNKTLNQKAIEDIQTLHLAEFVKFNKGQYLNDENLMLEKDAFANFKAGRNLLLIDETEKKEQNTQDIINNKICFTDAVHTLDIDNSLNELLQSKNKIFARPFRYPIMFFNRIFEIEPKNYIFGIAVCSLKLPNESFANLVSIIGSNYSTKKLWRGHFTIIGGQIKFRAKESIEDHFSLNALKISKYLAQIVVNLFDFLNHPEVTTKVLKWQNNETRIRKRKLPIPPRLVMTIKGKMYRYLYEEQPLKSNSRAYSCTFTVGGHYVHFHAKTRYNRLYRTNKNDLKDRGYQIDDTGLISKWVYPFTKGKGLFKAKKIMLEK